MITTTYTRRPLWVRLARPFAVTALHITIASAEEWVRNVRAGKVYTPEQIRQLESNIGPARVMLAWWEQQ